MPIEYTDEGTTESTCDKCGKTGRASVTVMRPPGIPAWSCPSCGHTQEP